MEVKISALGAYVPGKVVSNHDLEKLVDTSDEWILKRTGIRERRYCREGETVVDMSTNAVKDLLEHHNQNIHDVDFIIVCTTTAEHTIPSVASQVQYQLGIKNAGCIDLTAACAGFIYGLSVAKSLIVSGTHKKVLVIGADALSKVTNIEDRTTCILFGDGAGAALLEPSEVPGILKSVSGTEGNGGSALYLVNNTDTISGEPVVVHNKIVQDGRKVFKWAVERVSQKFKELLVLNGIGFDELDYFVPHSANRRIIESICNNVKFPVESTLISLEEYGNTSAASIPLALWKALRENKIKQGDTLLMIGFGGGLTHAGTIVRWAY